MFSKKETKASFSQGSTTLVARNTEIFGELKFNGNLIIEGKINGNIYSSEGAEAQVRVLEKGIVEGELKAPILVINGTVNGDVFSDKHIELASKAVVNGNVHYISLEMIKGAQVNGSLVFSGAKQSGKLLTVDKSDNNEGTETPTMESGEETKLDKDTPDDSTDRLVTDKLK